MALLVVVTYNGNAGHFNQAAQLKRHGIIMQCLAVIRNKLQPTPQLAVNLALYISLPTFLFQIANTHSSPFCFFGSDLHAVQCGAGAAHTAGPEAALLRQGPVAQGQQLAAQPQVLPAQPRLKATLGVLSEQLAASADVLSSELWERRRAVSIVPGEDTEIIHSTHRNTHKRGTLGACYINIKNT